MKIVPRHSLSQQQFSDRALTGRDDGPTAAELDAIEREMPLITAEVELLDVEISLMDRTPTEVDHKRLRRAQHKVLNERTALVNRSVTREAA
ncbi:DUF6284 family protein [Streptomyces sp. GbtcB6]|uniref:DUF6284 family protein n=1 Tax=Streptomyces sp. GbtcB6 TaxID=2824751 RepID=UPI0020C67F27|nr:DUF6284 family protein [Streptomyces sp. GbtcB6]